MAQRLRDAEKAGKEILLDSEEMVHVGIDTHKKDYRLNVWSEMRGRSVAQWVQPAQPQLLIRRLTPCKDRIARLVYEAGPTGYQLARALRQAGFPAEVIAPSRTPKSTCREAKSDRLDSRKLAMYSAKGLLQPVYVPTEEEEGDRQVLRARETIKKKVRRVKQQIKSLLLQHGIPQPDGLKHWALRAVAALRELPLSRQLRFSLDLLLDDLTHFSAQQKKANAAVRSLSRTQRHRAKAQALQTVSGVGVLTAMTVRTELLAPERFRNGREVTAMLGLAPLVCSSGQTRREGPIMKTGNQRLRTILIEAAWRWVGAAGKNGRDPWPAERFAQLVQNTGGKKKAIVGMARRLGIILWRISVTGEAYRPHPPRERTVSGEKQRRQPGLPDARKSGAAAANRRRPASVQSAGQ